MSAISKGRPEWSDTQRSQLISLIDACGGAAVLIGAGALARHVSFEWRETSDLDLVIKMPIDEATRRLSALSGWRQLEAAPHRWLAPGDNRFDVLPLTEQDLEKGRLTWPRTGRVMSLLGLRHVFAANAVEVLCVSERVRLLVPGVELICFLKMVSYMDQPRERMHDLGDIAHGLLSGVSIDECLIDEVFLRGIDMDVAGAFVLGRRLRALLNTRERDLALTFLERCAEPSVMATMEREAALTESLEALVATAVGAFRKGLLESD